MAGSRNLLGAVAALLLVAWANAVPAVTVSVVVDGHAEPWLAESNPSFPFGEGDGGDATVVSTADGFGFTAGDPLTITYVSGTVSNDGVYSFGPEGQVYIENDTARPNTLWLNDKAGMSGTWLPSYYMTPDWNTYVAALVATFADAAGLVVGSPFEVGAGVTRAVPAGAVRLQLGINDDWYFDNLGYFSVTVSGPGPSSVVPLPSALWLIGAGFLAYVGAGLRTQP